MTSPSPHESTIFAASRLLTGKPPPEAYYSVDTLVDLLRHHKLAAFGGYTVGESPAWKRVFSDDQADLLQHALRDAELRYRLVSDALRDALEVLEGIQPVLFKGLAVAESYPRAELRNPGDLDLLIDPARFLEAVLSLRNAGWTEQPTVHQHCSEAVAARYGFAKVFRHPTKPVIVDLHRTPVDRTEPFRIAIEPLLERSRERKLTSGVTVRVPHRLDHLALVTLHSVRHGYFRLYWCLDVYLMCTTRYSAADADCFRELCREHRIEKAVATGFGVAERLFGAFDHPCHDILDRLNLSRQIQRRAPEIIVHGHMVNPGGWRRVSAMVDLVDSVRDRLAYLFRTFFPEPQLVGAGQNISPGGYVSHRLRAVSRLMRNRHPGGVS